MKKFLLALLLTASAVPALHAQVRITEWAYNGSEFVEFTNLGSSAVDFTGWSFDDNTRVAGSLSLSAFGIVGAGESVLLSEVAASTFRDLWNIPLSVKIIGSNSQNLGRADEINLYNNVGGLVDRLTFDDQTIGGVRTDVTSAWAPNSALGQNTAATWIKSTVGDAQGSYTSSTGGYVGSPGVHAVPEPATVALVALACGLVIWRLRRTASRD